MSTGGCLIPCVDDTPRSEGLESGTNEPVFFKGGVMKKVIVLALAGGALALPGSVNAASPGVSCQLTPGGTVFSSPGEMFSDAREAFGFSPAQLAATFGYDNVGDMVRSVCSAG